MNIRTFLYLLGYLIGNKPIKGRRRGYRKRLLNKKTGTLAKV